jgi:Zn-dependent protease
MLERIPPREWRDLAIAWFAITLAFTVVFLRQSISVTGFILVFAASSVTVGVGFLLHELAHKFTAIRFGYWAEFRKDNLMLLLAVLLAALVGVVFAAPGATVIYSPQGAGLSRRENGLISAAGPGINLLLAIPFIAAAFLGTGLVAVIGAMGWQVNSMLAAFNMLPVGGLDGKKILAWNLLVFLALIGAAFVLLYLSFFPAVLAPFFPSLS